MIALHIFGPVAAGFVVLDFSCASISLLSILASVVVLVSMFRFRFLINLAIYFADLIFLSRYPEATLVYQFHNDIEPERC